MNIDTLSTKNAVPSIAGRPACYGISFEPVRTCRGCAFRRDCQVACMFWEDRRSLSELLAEAEKALKVDATCLYTMYAKLHHSYYGKKVSVEHLKRSLQAIRAINWVEEFCKSSGVDPVVWMTAQMNGFQKCQANPNFKFYPNMLQGERAKLRYNIYLEITDRRYNRAAGDSLDSKKEIFKLLDTLTLDEESIGDYYVAAFMRDETVRLSDAIRAVPVSSVWTAFNSHDRKRSGIAIVANLPQDMADSLVKIARLRAAQRVTNSFKVGLSDSVGVSDFTWQSLASFLKRLFPNRPQVKVVRGGTDSDTGMVWA